MQLLQRQRVFLLFTLLQFSQADVRSVLESNWVTKIFNFDSLSLPCGFLRWSSDHHLQHFTTI